MPRLVACLVVPSPMTSALLHTTAPVTSSVKMQYGAQGYDQQGYGAQQGYDQQGYGAQQGYAQQGYGALWTIHAFNGVTGHTQFSGAVSAVNQNRFGSVSQKYSVLPYSLIADDERILSKWNMVNNQVPTVSRSQCKVNIYGDGTAVLTSNGSCAPTLVRAQGGAWNAIYERQTHILSNGDQISLDANNPEGAVFTCQSEAAAQQGGYPAQQGGYPPQQGYPQQGGNGY